MSRTKYTIEGELGKGGFGVVYLLKGSNGEKVRTTRKHGRTFWGPGFVCHLLTSVSSYSYAFRRWRLT